MKHEHEKHESHMRWAIALALEGAGNTSPNPVVGAVVVAGDQVVGEGYHMKAGTPHAEVHAIKDAGELAEGADLYVTLEPCCIHGRTPPCVEMIVASGIRRVFVGNLDPNPSVNGRGIRALRKAGIEVVTGILAENCRNLNESYNKFITKGIPFVTAKVAVSLDGKIATATGDSKWITNTACREYVHRLRNTSDAVVIGAGTLKRDDPVLNVRIPSRTKDPIAIVVDERLRIPVDSNVLKRRTGGAIFVTTNLARKSDINKIENMGHKVVVCKKTKDNMVSLCSMLEKLGEMEVTSVLVEGGAEIFSDFVKRGLVDRLIVCIAPKLVGGQGKDFLPGISIGSISKAYNLHDVEFKTFGDNIVVEGSLGTGRACSQV